jgi:AraC family transcriptional regulator
VDAVGVRRARVTAVLTRLHGDDKDCAKHANRRENPSLVDRVLINPPAASLGSANAIVAGRSRRYEAENVEGALSIKCVVEGVATWETANGRFELGPAGWLILEDGERYSITVDAARPVETFCVFFKRGFVEDAASGVTLECGGSPPPMHFAERLRSSAAVRNALLRARDHRDDAFALDSAFHAIAGALVQAHGDAAARAARLPALRAATREEIARRLDRAVAYIHGHLAEPLSIAAIASVACLSPFHFHRLFTGYFGETPHRAISRLRLERAAALLRGSDAEVSDVAAACGFASLGSFSALFARTFGAPPSRFRKNEEAALRRAG